MGLRTLYVQEGVWRMNQNNSTIEIYKKVWGFEHWIVNKEYCGKKLILFKGYRCSYHYHKIKDETFYILSGKVLMEINGEERIMLPGDKVHILPYTKHRFSGIEPSEIMEFSTHHIEEDSYRESESGRVDQP